MGNTHEEDLTSFTADLQVKEVPEGRREKMVLDREESLVHLVPLVKPYF